MTDTALNTSRAALKTKIDTAIGTASIDDARKLAKIAKLIGESDNTSFETAVNTRINSLATSATTDELVKLAETIGFVTDTTTSSALLDLSAIQQNLVPDTTDIRNLGSASKQWDNLYLNAGTIQTTPSAADHIVNKAYVDSRTVTTGDIIPDVADTHDLGSSSKKYVEVHTARVLGLSATPTVAGEAASKAYVDSEVGALTSVSTSAPSSPNNGDFWFDSDNAALLISYDDGSGSQWVEVSGFSAPAPAAAGSGGVTTYADMAALAAATGMSVGNQALVTATNSLFMYLTAGWYKIAVVNESPTAITGVNASYSLATDGSATTITAVSTDPEGLPLTWSYTVSTGSLTNGGGTTATVALNANVFTITPTTTAAYVGNFSITFTATDNVNGIATSVSSFTIAFTVPNSRYTELLATAVAASDNNNITDSSSNNHTITVAGDTYASTFSPYRSGGYSTYFDGSSLISAATPAAIGSQDYTIEFWMNSPNVTSTWQSLVSRDYNNSDSFRLYKKTSTSELAFYSGGSVRATTSGAGLTNNVWHHIAVVRNSGTLQIYVDGVSKASVSNSDDISEAAAPINIGGNTGEVSSYPFTGYIRDMRVVNGTAVYTSAFTPPTEPLTAITNTALLTCHLPYIADGSTNAHAITVNGNVSITPFSMDDYLSYSAGTNGGSVYFDGVGDYLSIGATGAPSEFGSGDFTLEMWYKGTDTDQYATLTSKGAGGFTSGDWSLMMNTTVPSLVGNIAFYVHDYNPASPMLITGDVSASDNAWVHIAVVRSGNDWNLYVNGVSEAYVDSSTTINDTSSVVLIGADHSYGRYLSGFISDYRIVKGTAVYTAAFTPPTEPLTATADTKFLLNPETSISDLSQTSLLKPFGNTVTSSSQVKFAGTRSVYFDGVGDYLTAPSSATMGIGTGDFTIECWFYATDGAIDVGVWDTHSQSSSSDGLTLTRITPTTFRVWDSSQILVSSATAITDNWNHLAVVRNGGTLELFVNGVSQGTVSNSTNMNSAQEIVIGAGRYENSASPTAFVKGYMQDFRITKGLARYTTNFTPSQIGELLG